MQNLIKYKDIEKDKSKYINILNYIRKVYQLKELHVKVLECDQWVTMLNRKPIKTEYTSDALLALSNIMNDAANYFLSVGPFETGELAMNMMNKISEIYKENKNGNF